MRNRIGYSPYANSTAYQTFDIRFSSTREMYEPVGEYRNGVTYIAWVDKATEFFVTAFDHATSSFNIVKIGLASDVTGDADHANPTLCIDGDGYIYVFYGCHNSQLVYRKSTNPYDISAWSSKLSVHTATEATYPLPIVIGSKILVFYRHGNSDNKSQNVVETTNGGTNWTNNTVLLNPSNSTWAYTYGIAYSGNNIHFVTNLRPLGAIATDPFGYSYYMKSTDAGATWQKADGTAYTLPADQNTLEQVAGDGSYPGDIKLNSQGYPYLTYMNNATIGVKFKRWNGSAWTTAVDVCQVGTYQFETIRMDIINDSTIDIYTIKGTGGTMNGGDIYRYRSTDTGATWSLAERVTTDATSTYRHYFPRLIRNAHPSMKMFYTSGAPVFAYNRSDRGYLHTYP